MRIRKAFQSIFLQGNFHRVWQILLKSPLTHLLADLHALRFPQVKKNRVALIQNLCLDRDQERILSELHTNGFARVDPLFSEADFIPLQAYLEEKIKQLDEARKQQTSSHKDFWIRLSDSDLKQGMTPEHPLVRLSLKRKILEVIAAYLKQAPFLEYILLTYSVPSEQPLKSSQLWHQDHDNAKMIKLFFYLSHVDSELDGPFTLLPKSANQRIRNSFFPRHLPDSEVEPQYPLSQAVQIRGGRFSAFLVDTSVCYHMGSRVAEAHSRLMSTSLFVALPKSYWGPVQNFIQNRGVQDALQRAAIESDFQP